MEESVIPGISSFGVYLQVAAIYKDSSIGNLINIVIVKLVVIHSEQVRSGIQGGLWVVAGFWWD